MDGPIHLQRQEEAKQPKPGEIQKKKRRRKKQKSTMHI
jgi:hypothetical protein